MRNKNTHLVASLQLYPNSYEMLHTSAENLETKSFSVAPLRTSHAWRASKSWQRAFKNDPMFAYLAADEKRGAIGQCLDRIAMAALISFYSKRRIGYTVNSGEAYIAAVAADSEYIRFRWPTGWAHHAFLKVCSRYLAKSLFGSKEQRMRLKEGMDKYLEALAKGLHGREGEMFDVMYLATDPSVQGRGYGGALLNEITAEADKMNKSTWLQCSNYLNAHFYISHGFETVSEYMLGGDNPKWIALDHKPVLIQIMVRHPPGYSEKRSIETEYTSLNTLDYRESAYSEK